MDKYLSRIGPPWADYAREWPIEFIHLKYAGATWIRFPQCKRGIWVNEQYKDRADMSTWIESLILHETVHLVQGWRGALSIKGELEAWQEQARYLDKHGALGSSTTHVTMRHMLELSLDDCTDLWKARLLMRIIGGRGYHSELLPLRPI